VTSTGVIVNAQAQVDASGEVIGFPSVVELKAEGLRQALAVIANQLKCAMEQHELTDLVVQELSCESNVVLKPTWAVGRYVTEIIARRFQPCSQSGYCLANGRVFAPGGDGSSKADLKAVLTLLTHRANSVGLVFGTLTFCSDRQVIVQCTLIEADSRKYVESVSATARLTESEWAMLSGSLQLTDTEAPADVD
jgi:hypothetical protein